MKRCSFVYDNRSLQSLGLGFRGLGLCRVLGREHFQGTLQEMLVGLLSGLLSEGLGFRVLAGAPFGFLCGVVGHPV